MCSGHKDFSSFSASLRIMREKIREMYQKIDLSMRIPRIFFRNSYVVATENDSCVKEECFDLLL